MNDLIGPKSSDQSTFTVNKIEGLQHYMGTTEDGFPVFFVRTNASKSSTAPIKLKLLEAEFLQRCTLIDDCGNQCDDIYSKISLKSSDKDLGEIFRNILIMALRDMDSFPSCREISIAVDNISSIFSQVSSKSSQTIQGLWAELLIIEQSKFPEVLISAWHQEYTDTYDFTQGANKIEVKSTSKDKRVHRFSGDQLTPTRHSNLIVASVQVKSSGPGEGAESVKSLCEKIISRVTVHKWQNKLQTIIFQTLGNDYASYATKYFDYISAVDSIKYYYLLDIDRIKQENIPSAVSKVEYDVDFSNVPAIGDDDSTFNLHNKQLFQALL